ncbi:MAG: hypothetical protein ACO1O1_05065 [Adhaeribacter sp.]
MYKISSLLGGIALLLTLQPGQAQDLGNSPYSRIGLGDLNPAPGNIRNFGMGLIGVSTPNGSHAQVENPALLYYVNRVSFEMAGTGQLKSIDNGQEKKQAGNGGLNYLALSVPVTKAWRSAIGLRPFSMVNYATSKAGNVVGAPEQTPAIAGNTGEGTISEAYFSNGVRLFKGLTVGVTGSYIFGGIDKNAYTQLQDSAGLANATQLVLNEHVNYSDLLFKGGLTYRKSLGKKVNATLGGVYGFETQLDQKTKTILQRRRASDLMVIAETDLGDSSQTQVTLPGFWEAGLSFDNANNWVIGAEVSARNWSAYNGSDAARLRNSLRVGVGGEYVPDPTSIDSYLKRVSYRAGFSYAKTPYYEQGQQINDKSVHAGVSLPIGSVPRPPEYNQSFINLGVALGQQGSAGNGLLQEKYVRFMVGLTLNSSWFIKPKFD